MVAMTAPRQPRSQLAVLAPPTTSDEVRDRRWMRLWEHGVAEIEVEQIQCAILREKIIAECRRQNGRQG